MVWRSSFRKAWSRMGGASLLRDLQEIAPIFALHTPFHVIPGWGDRITALMKTVELAEGLSVPMVTFHPPKWLGLEVKFWRWMYTVRDFQRELGGGRVTIAMENMPYRGRSMRFTPYMFGKTEDIVRFIAGGDGDAHEIMRFFPHFSKLHNFLGVSPIFLILAHGPDKSGELQLRR